MRPSLLRGGVFRSLSPSVRHEITTLGSFASRRPVKPTYALAVLASPKGLGQV